jgi:putative membrane protein
VLAAFAGGLAIGALGMVPRWWMHRNAVRRAREQLPSPPAAAPAAPASPHGL